MNKTNKQTKTPDNVSLNNVPTHPVPQNPISTLQTVSIIYNSIGGGFAAPSGEWRVASENL
jgi:hypothetical protein